jgi:large subunit ribosomal protein L12e
MCSQDKNIKHTGSISLSDVIEIARIMRPRSCARNLAGTCKEILGTAVSVGCKCDGKHPSVVMEAVSANAHACAARLWWGMP